MSISSDLIEERSVTQIIYDANKSSSLLLSGTKIIIQELIVNQNEIQIDVQGITYNTVTTPWNNITNGPDLIKSLIQPTNSSTLNVNNTIQIQNSSDSPTQTIVISSDISGNRIGIDGDYGSANQMLKSGGTNDDIFWGPGETLSEILTNDNVANRDIDMNEHSIKNISSVSIHTTPVSTPNLTLTRLSFPITIDGNVYYLPLYSNI